MINFIPELVLWVARSTSSVSNLTLEREAVMKVAAPQDPAV